MRFQSVTNLSPAKTGRRRLAALGGLLLLTVACKMGPDYQRPGVVVGETHRWSEESGTSIAALPWWEVFGDPQLKVLIQTALDNNKDLQLSMARIEEARANVGIVRADLFPSIDALGSASRSRLSAATHPAPEPTTIGLALPAVPPNPSRSASLTIQPSAPSLYSNSYDTGLSLSYELDLWGRVRRATEAARAELLATEESRQTIVSALVAEVAGTYFQLRELDRELTIAERTLLSRTEAEGVIRLQHEHGVVSGLDLERAIGETAATAATIGSIKRGIAQTENALNLLLGNNPGDVIRGMELESQPLPPEVPAGLPAELLDRRPDIRLAEAQLMAANARIGEAKALFFPSLSLTGALGFQSNALNEWLEHNAHTWTIAADAAQPVFQGGRLVFNYRATKARREQALVNYLSVIQRSLIEVSNALASRKFTREESVQYQRQVTALTNASRIARDRYDGGEAGYLEVLDAERELFKAELQQAQTRFLELLSVVQIYRALGGGWTVPTEAATAPTMEAGAPPAEMPAEDAVPAPVAIPATPTE